MRRTQLLLLLLSFVIGIVGVQAQTTGPWDIGVDLGGTSGTPTVTPTKPVARIGDDDILTIQILNGGKIPNEDHALLRFAQPVLDVTQTAAGGLTLRVLRLGGGTQPQFTEPGTAHLLRFRKCSQKLFTSWKWPNGQAVTEADCPLIVSNGQQNITVFSNTDSVALLAEVDTRPADSKDDPFSPQNVRRAPFTVRTVRPFWNLGFSTGFSFFTGNKIRDERYRLVPASDDASTPNVDESKTKPQEIIAAGHGESPYEFGAFATYMFHRPELPFGVTFGASTKIPVDQLTGVVGITFRIKPFPVTDSAYLTVGTAYRAHKRLMAKYRDTLQAPAGVSEADVLESAHDMGFFVAVSFGFGGGDTQFKKVVSGQ